MRDFRRFGNRGFRCFRQRFEAAVTITVEDDPIPHVKRHREVRCDDTLAFLNRDGDALWIAKRVRLPSFQYAVGSG